MRNNKYAVLVLLYFSLLSFSLLYGVYRGYKEYVLLYDLLVGIFSGSVLALFISIINYRIERRRTLENFCSNIIKFINLFEYYVEYKGKGDIDRAIRWVLEVNRFDYSELGNCFADIDFIFNNRANKKYIYDSIYEPIKVFSRLIKRHTIHFVDYNNSTYKNHDVIDMFLKEIDDYIMDYSEFRIDETIIISSNSLTSKLSKELNGRYYKIMYPNLDNSKW